MPKTPRLREWRERAALSQGELAARSGISRATIADLEAGNRGAQPKTVRRLAEALYIEPEELYGEPTYPKGSAPPAPQPSLLNGLEEERRLDDEAALAVLFRGLTRRALLIAQRSRRGGPSAELSEEVAELHKEANALYQLRGRRDIFGRASGELAEAEAAYEEAESTIQAMLRQDVEATDEERDMARRFRPEAGDTSNRREADAS